MAPESNPSELTDVVQNTLIGVFATVFQYALPAIFGVGAVVSLTKRIRDRRLGDSLVTGDHGARAINDLSWREFERAVGELFRRQGYVVKSTPEGADGGVDLILSKEGDTYLVQCKHWKASKVNADVVRSLFGVMVDRGAAGGFVVASGDFTQPAEQFARNKNISLVRAQSLIGVVQKTVSADTSFPACPRCGKFMVRRRARRGSNAGSEFWGCPDFPSCRGTRELESARH